MATTRLELPDGQWVDIKATLKVKDRRDIHSYSVDGMSTDGKTYRFNVVNHQIGSAAARIVKWQLAGVKAFPVAASFTEKVAAIADLDEDVFEVITAALNAHDKAADAEAESEKNGTADGGTGSDPTSPSAD